MILLDRNITHHIGRQKTLHLVDINLSTDLEQRIDGHRAILGQDSEEMIHEHIGTHPGTKEEQEQVMENFVKWKEQN